MEIISGFTHIAYFENNFKKKYYIIGEVTPIWSAIYPDSDKKVDVCLFLVKAFAGTSDYFRQQKIPLTPKKFKKAFPRNPSMIFKNTPIDLRNQSEYVRKSVRQEKKSFLFYVRCALSSWKKEGNDRIFDPLDIYYALLPLVHKGMKPNRFEERDPSSNYSAKMSEHIRSHLWCDLTKEGDELIMSYQEYQKYLFSIANIIYEFRAKEKFTKQDIVRLNRYKPPKDNPIKEFIYSFLYEFKEALRREKRLGICCVCGTAFRYKEVKKYCNEKCLKTRENAAYYDRYKSTLLPKKLKVNKELRECYREHKIRK